MSISSFDGTPVSQRARATLWQATLWRAALGLALLLPAGALANPTWLVLPLESTSADDAME